MCLLSLVWLLSVSPVPAKDRKAADAYALIAGTVFDERGFALRAAEVTISASATGKPPKKFKKGRLLSDARGEFAFRVPPVPFEYKVSVSAAGFAPQEKKVTVSADERHDLFFQLAPAKSQ